MADKVEFIVERQWDDDSGGFYEFAQSVMRWPMVEAYRICRGISWQNLWKHQRLKKDTARALPRGVGALRIEYLRLDAVGLYSHPAHLAL